MWSIWPILELLPRQVMILYMRRLALFTVLVAILGACLPKQPLGQMYYIDSIPPEAQVYTMGILQGETPLEIELSPGVNITVSKQGYREVTLDQKTLSSGYAMVKLDRLYKLKLSYTPEGSEVWENGKLLGKTPFVAERIAGKAKYVVRHQYHDDLVDEFMVDGDTYRLKTLKPSVKYFPSTVSTFSSRPSGVQIDMYDIADGSIMDKTEAFGKTPFELANADLMRKALEHLFVFKKDGYAPRVLTGNGSFFAHINMSKQESYAKATGAWVSSLEYKTGELVSPSKSYTLWALERDGKLAIVSKKSADVEVDILDMKTDFSAVSGASWLDDRFFVVRSQNVSKKTIYIMYDAIARRRFRIEDAGFWHEAFISGSIEWKLQIPIKPSQIEEFTDIVIQVSKNFSVATFRLYDGLPLEFTVVSDTLFDHPRLVGLEE